MRFLSLAWSGWHYYQSLACSFPRLRKVSPCPSGAVGFGHLRAHRPLVRCHSCPKWSEDVQRCNLALARTGYPWLARRSASNVPYEYLVYPTD